MFIVTIIVALFIYIINEMLQALPNYKTLIIESFWIFADLVHVPQFVIPFIIILYITKGRPNHYGFNLREDPPEFTHIRMLIIGIFSGLLMSIKYIIQIVKGLPLDVPQPATPTNILGYITFQWIVVGFSEETMFRGLIQTYFLEKLEGEIKIAGHIVHIGTVIAALFWGGFHVINILYMPLSTVISIVVITTPIGLLMGYAYQRTRSILTTILVHNTLFGVPLTVGYILQFVGY